MEGHVWPELQQYFRASHGLDDAGSVTDLLDPDSRWTELEYVGPSGDDASPPVAATRDIRSGPLASASTVAEVETYPRPDPSWLVPGDYRAFAERYPDRARILIPGWRPLFWGACEAFGFERALTAVREEPALFEAFVEGQHTWYMSVLRRAVAAAQEHVDICWLGDDCAGQHGMLIAPADWRRIIKPRLAQQVRLIREHGMRVMLHSCGAVRPILGDLIDIGVSALLVFQTSAAGMDAASIARDFGGRMAFYGGIDVQGVLSTGTPAEVAEEVQRNVRAFRRCGGYVVANAHHGVSSIRGENIEAMFEAARRLAAREQREATA